jgi:hypothetical protein
MEKRGRHGGKPSTPRCRNRRRLTRKWSRSRRARSRDGDHGPCSRRFISCRHRAQGRRSMPLGVIAPRRAMCRQHCAAAGRLPAEGRVFSKSCSQSARGARAPLGIRERSAGAQQSGVHCAPGSGSPSPWWSPRSCRALRRAAAGHRPAGAVDRGWRRSVTLPANTALQLTIIRAS